MKNPFSLLYKYKQNKIKHLALNYVGSLLPPIEGKYKPNSYRKKEKSVDLLELIER